MGGSPSNRALGDPVVPQAHSSRRPGARPKRSRGSAENSVLGVPAEGRRAGAPGAAIWGVIPHASSGRVLQPGGMSFFDADAARRHPAAFAALRRGDAAGALEALADQDDPAARRVAGRALLALGDRDGARRALLAALADASDDPAAQALAHADLAAVARATGEPARAIGHLEWALIDAPAAARAGLHREATTIASRAGLLADAEFHARAALAAPATSAVIEADDRARLGAVLAAQARYDEAVDHLQRAVQTLLGNVGAGHADTLAARAELAESLAAAGRAVEATVEHEAVLEGRAAALGHDHPELAPTLLALAALSGTCEGDDARADARAYALRAVDVLHGRVPVDHPLLADARTAAATWIP